MKVSLISGIMMARDAISSSTRHKVLALRELCGARGVELGLRIFVHASDYDLEGSVKRVSSVNEVVYDRHFLESELVIYDFGIYTDLFDSIHLAPARARKLVHFHNITPASLVPEQDRGLIDRSFQQLINVFKADAVLTGSPYNRRTLLEYGVEPSRIRYLSYVVDALDGPGPEPRRRDGPIGLLFVGRFVASKGVLDLLESFAAARAGGAGAARLALVGSLQFSDPQYVAAVRARIEALGLRESVDFVGEVSDVERDQHYARADALIMPSYHEGFCVPVIEALHQGCNVLAYDAGNLKDVLNGLGTLVPPGDKARLAEQLARYIRRKTENRSVPDGLVETDSGLMAESQFLDSTRAYTRGFSFSGFKDQLASILTEVGLLPPALPGAHRQ